MDPVSLMILTTMPPPLLRLLLLRLLLLRLLLRLHPVVVAMGRTVVRRGVPC